MSSDASTTAFGELGAEVLRRTGSSTSGVAGTALTRLIQMREAVDLATEILLKGSLPLD